MAWSMTASIILRRHSGPDKATHKKMKPHWIHGLESYNTIEGQVESKYPIRTQLVVSRQIIVITLTCAQSNTYRQDS